LLDRVAERNKRDRLNHSGIVSSRNDETKNDLQAATDALGVRSKDSNDLVTAKKREEGDLGSTPEFAGNNYWRPPTTDEDLDEMLRAEGML